METLKLIATTLLLFALVGIGLTLTITSMRKEIRERRVEYRRSSGRSTDGATHEAYPPSANVPG
jgi:hypothetical protein